MNRGSDMESVGACPSAACNEVMRPGKDRLVPKVGEAVSIDERSSPGRRTACLHGLCHMLSSKPWQGGQYENLGDG